MNKISSMVKFSSEFILQIAMIILKQVCGQPDDKSEPEELNFTEITLINMKAPTYTDICSRRIAGGHDVDIIAVPFQVAMRRSIQDGMYWFTFCGGTIVTLNFVLAAAHCYVVPEFEQFRDNVRAVAGSVKSEVNVYTLLVEHWRRVKTYYYHEKFDAKVLLHDIALLQLEEPFIESEKVKPIRMHSPSTKVKMTAGTSCLVSGYGKLANDVRSKHLQMICTPIISRVNCTAFYGQEYITRSVFCAGSENTNTCQGDSGGPIVCKGILVGIISWGRGCDGNPGVYTRIHNYTQEKHVSFIKIEKKKEDYRTVGGAPPYTVSLQLGVIIVLVFIND